MQNKRITVVFLVFLLTTGLFIAYSCKKENSCYDQQLYEQHKNDFCTMDCPGVKGCDGKTYCNECEANKQGIRVVK